MTALEKFIHLEDYRQSLDKLMAMYMEANGGKPASVVTVQQLMVWAHTRAKETWAEMERQDAALEASRRG